MRQLIGIALVDVVAYSRLMAADEEGTLRAWHDLRGLIDPIFETGGARIVKSTGDGMLIAAPSVIELVRSAVRALEAAAEWNRQRAAGEEIRLRIGVNLGDVILDETGDIYGDGVNVAARLEGVADPGTLCMSETVYQQVRGRVEAALIDRGMHRLKNLPVPIRVWAIAPGLPAYRPSPPTRSRVKLAVATVSFVAVALIGTVAFFRLFDPAGTGATSTTLFAAGSEPTSVIVSEWTVEFQSDVSAVTSVGDLLIVVLSEGTVEALDAGGNRLWRTPITGDCASTVGCTADALVLAVAGGDLLYVGDYGSRVIRAIDVASGSEAWRALLALDFSVGVPDLAVSGDALYAGYGFGVTRLNAFTGAEEWTNPLVASSPIGGIAALESLVLVRDSRFVRGVKPDDGRVAWQLGPPRLRDGALGMEVRTVLVDLGLSGSIESRVMVVSGDQELLVLDGRSGTVVWSVLVSGMPVFVDDAVFVADVDGGLAAFAAGSGAELWSRSDIAVDGLVSAEGKLLVVSGSELLVVNPRSGTTMASTSLTTAPTGPPVLVGGVIAVPMGSSLVAVRAPG